MMAMALSHPPRLCSSRPSEETNSTLFENEAFLKDESEDDEMAPRSKRKTSKALPWKISTFFLGVLSAFLCVLNIHTVYHSDPYVRQSDLPDARKAIKYEQRVWSGALTFDVPSNRIVRLDDSPIEYVGSPSKEIDDAWTKLLKRKIYSQDNNCLTPKRPEMIVTVYFQINLLSCVLKRHAPSSRT